MHKKFHKCIAINHSKDEQGFHLVVRAELQGYTTVKVHETFFTLAADLTHQSHRPRDFVLLIHHSQSP